MTKAQHLRAAERAVVRAACRVVLAFRPGVRIDTPHVCRAVNELCDRVQQMLYARREAARKARRRRGR
jgi:hypothetical protein